MNLFIFFISFSLLLSYTFATIISAPTTAVVCNVNEDLTCNFGKKLVMTYTVTQNSNGQDSFAFSDLTNNRIFTSSPIFSITSTPAYFVYLLGLNDYDPHGLGRGTVYALWTERYKCWGWCHTGNPGGSKGCGNLNRMANAGICTGFLKCGCGGCGEYWIEHSNNIAKVYNILGITTNYQVCLNISSNNTLSESVCVSDSEPIKYLDNRRVKVQMTTYAGSAVSPFVDGSFVVDPNTGWSSSFTNNQNFGWAFVRRENIGTNCNQVGMTPGQFVSTASCDGKVGDCGQNDPVILWINTLHDPPDNRPPFYQPKNVNWFLNNGGAYYRIDNTYERLVVIQASYDSALLFSFRPQFIFGDIYEDFVVIGQGDSSVFIQVENISNFPGTALVYYQCDSWDTIGSCQLNIAANSFSNCTGIVVVQDQGTPNTSRCCFRLYTDSDPSTDTGSTNELQEKCVVLVAKKFQPKEPGAFSAASGTNLNADCGTFAVFCSGVNFCFPLDFICIFNAGAIFDGIVRILLLVVGVILIIILICCGVKCLRKNKSKAILIKHK